MVQSTGIGEILYFLLFVFCFLPFTRVWEVKSSKNWKRQANLNLEILFPSFTIASEQGAGPGDTQLGKAGAMAFCA